MDAAHPVGPTSGTWAQIRPPGAAQGPPGPPKGPFWANTSPFKSPRGVVEVSGIQTNTWPKNSGIGNPLPPPPLLFKAMQKNCSKMASFTCLTHPCWNWLARGSTKRPVHPWSCSNRRVFVLIKKSSACFDRNSACPPNHPSAKNWTSEGGG